MRRYFIILSFVFLIPSVVSSKDKAGLSSQHSAIMTLLDTNLDSAEHLASRLLSESLQEKDYWMAGNAAYLVGYCNDVNNKLLNSGMRYFEAIQYLSKSENRDHEFEAKVLISLGRITNLVGKNIDAISYYQAALEKTALRKTRGIIIFNIAYVYYSQKEYDKALVKFLESYEIFYSESNYSMSAYCLNYLGLCHHYTKGYSEARGFFQRILDAEPYLEPKEFTTYQGWALHNTANAYFEEGKFDLALTTYYQALAIKKQNPDSTEQFTTLLDIGELQLKQGKYVEAIDYLSKAAGMYEMKAHNPETFKVFDFLEEAYRLTGNPAHETYLKRLKTEYNDYVTSIQEMQTMNQGYQLDLLQQQVLDRFNEHKNIQYWKSRAYWMVPLFSILAGLMVYLVYKEFIRRRNERTLDMLAEL